MKTPVFWGRRGPAALLLFPFGSIYALATYLRFYFVKPQRVGVPVLCIGGLSAGGSGKTPVCLHIGELCKEAGINAWFLSRGYKGTINGPVQVKPTEHTAYDVGDEPLLLARMLPTIVSKKRLQGAQFAARQGAELIIMDDGFQNPYIHKDKSFVVLDGTIGIGNGFLIPAGPLRELPKRGFRRADAVIVINPKKQLTYLPKDKPVFFSHLKTNNEAVQLNGKRVVAFCGLAYPQKFFDTLQPLGSEIILQKTFPDHYQYSDEELDALALEAKNRDAILVTTSKDAARMNPRALTLVTVVHVTLAFDQPDALKQLILGMAGRA